jgi:hypothetical protein
MLTKLEQTLKNKINKGQKARILQAAQICYLALKESEGLFVPLCFKNGTLYLKSKNSTAAAEVLLGQKQIIEKINKKLGINLVKKIRVRASF